MENEISKGKSLFFLAITWFICYLVGSLFSWSFDMEDWHLFSKIVFWGPSIVLSVWTLNDYFFSSKK